MANKQLNAHEYESIYNELGINIDMLGCVMADLEPFPAEFLMASAIEIGSDSYVSNNEERNYINGLSLQDQPHITLLYGLLANANKLKRHIDYLFENWNMNTVEIESIDYFDSPIEDEPYYCIVAHIKLTDELLEAHARLEFLPHINTYSSFLPHLTLAYVKKDEQVRDRVLDFFRKHLIGQELLVKKGLNLGYEV